MDSVSRDLFIFCSSRRFEIVKEEEKKKKYICVGFKLKFFFLSFSRPDVIIIYTLRYYPWQHPESIISFAMLS